MFNRFMITAATAALIAGTGFAYAQGSMSREGPGAGAGVQQSAPSSPSAGGATSRESSEGMKAGQSEEKGGLRNQRAQDTKPGALGEKSTGEKSAQETGKETGKGDKSKSMSSQNEKGAPGKDKELKAEDRERGGNMKAEGRREDRDGNLKAEGHDNNPAAKENRSQTIGQAGAGAKLSTEQRTRISTIIRNQRVAPATNINFAVSIGTRVPREIGFHPLPAEIVTIYPEWRGYEFFLVRDEIVVVDPRTLEIVAVLPA
jgi:hypothetical protein